MAAGRGGRGDTRPPDRGVRGAARLDSLV